MGSLIISMDNFLIRTNLSKDEGLETTNQIKEYLEKHGKSVFVELLDEAQIKAGATDESFRNGEKPDIVLVLGGDGTMLRAARDFMDLSVPLIGVNLGSVGYLTEVEKENVISALDKIISGEYEVEERMMIEGTFYQNGEKAGEFKALNDISVLKTLPIQAIGFNIFVNGRFLKDYSADGVIVSTPTGSTGYNLSAGGPIVEPVADLMVLTPVSPHTLMTRSIVLSPSDEIKIEIKEAPSGGVKNAIASADSANTFEMKSGDYVTLRRSEKRIKTVKVSSLSFLEVLAKKLR